MKESSTEVINEVPIVNHQDVKLKIRHFLKVYGPGLIVMLADTDAGCLITAAQSGAQWGYAMVLPQLLLIPILYAAQEMTVRLGIVTQQGHGELIRQHFGKGWAWLSAGTLGISAVGALLTEFIGIAGVGELFGVSKWLTIPAATMLLIGIAFCGSYHRVEKIGVMIGLAELAFLVAMFMAKPQPSDFVQGLTTVPWKNSSYVYLVAANVGAVIMPWMIFYQQGAVIDKHLSKKDISKEKHDTLVGTLLTQGIMIMFVITFAATVGVVGHHVSLSSVSDLATAISPYIGSTPAKIFTGLSLMGGSLVAALVVALAGTWGVTEVLNWRHSLNERLNKSNVGFYTIYCLAHIIGAVIVLMNIDLVDIAVSVEVMNALLLPIVLGFLLLLEAKALPKEYRMHGLYRFFVTSACLVVMIFGMYMVGPTLGIW
ncbi:divalent metal cation transporter [Weissella paramesenteroides]|uniref:Metal ion transporter, metal ion (Mn2+/Fe2+) transporter (Nramp) family n=1 Tax=Weissella paramesenteroides ATCC 33313 TaxID=585506 RepID=C5R9E4_WEIPA|nr:divalent metal cation transporter [Weissella paramesenteroides]ATF42185.1 divalent metal cation transporter [Weissella paramesenteroides]EER75044.1 metal ion transporter, metal ion (Mn2+/Fe2+) transporter (Nramp) family [Weissella paramesenteroides ATCC 33313]MCM6764591.1 divalent metal cation transporter [Weissella paramesenteroides]MCM6768299.1 divalent metal cation transporter [Weissella paramesenteroides]MCM6768455.1 divalent metal cation transporter [Weissella paramesenteroides]